MLMGRPRHLQFTVTVCAIVFGSACSTASTPAPGPMKLSCSRTIKSYCALSDSHCPTTPCEQLEAPSPPLGNTIYTNCGGFDVVDDGTANGGHFTFYFDHRTGAIAAAIVHNQEGSGPRNVHWVDDCLGGPAQVYDTASLPMCTGPITTCPVPAPPCCADAGAD